MTNAVVMSADDVPDQATDGQILRIECIATAFYPFRISQFFENLINRELQLAARGLELLVRLDAQIDIESMKDAGCRWAQGYDLANGLSSGRHWHSPPATVTIWAEWSSNLCHSG